MVRSLEFPEAVQDFGLGTWARMVRSGSQVQPFRLHGRVEVHESEKNKPGILDNLSPRRDDLKVLSHFLTF